MNPMGNLTNFKKNTFRKMIKARTADRPGIKKIYLGLAIIAFSLILPKFIWYQQFSVLNNLYNSIAYQDSGLLIITSAKLVLLNTIRHLPIYAGVFITAEGISQKYRISELVIFFIFLITVPVIYHLISSFYNIFFIFAGPSYLSVLMVTVIHKITRDIKPIFIKIIIISLFLFSLDWLDIVPYLSHSGFGRGEIAVSIKQATEFMEANHTMNFVGLTFAVIVFVNACILSQVAVGYYHRLHLIRETQQNEKRLKRLELEAIKSRYLKEVKHLVHDLKTPLVTIQGLSGVIKLKTGDEKIADYADKVCNAAEEMSLMISEILNEDTRHRISLDRLLDFVKVQLSLEEYEDMVQFDIEPEVYLYVNKFRMSRAVINLIDNAIKATGQKEEKIMIRASREKEKVKILVEDRGEGIAEKNLDDIWKAGFTTNVKNTGLGLSFVKQVIDSHGGEIEIKSAEGYGTKVQILLPAIQS